LDVAIAIIAAMLVHTVAAASAGSLGGGTAAPLVPYAIGQAVVWWLTLTAIMKGQTALS
jgi:hypothetical protein